MVRKMLAQAAQRIPGRRLAMSSRPPSSPRKTSPPAARAASVRRPAPAPSKEAGPPSPLFRPALPPSAEPVAPPRRTVRQPRQRHHAGRAQILAAIRASAIDVFSRHGFAGTTMQAVAEGAGLTKQQLLYYAGSKDELYANLLHEVVNEWREAFSLTEEAGHTPAQLLRDYVHRKLHYALANGPVSRIFTAEMLAGGTHIARYWPEMLASTQSKARLLQRWMDAGLLRRRDPLLLLQQIWGMTQYYADYQAQVAVMMGAQPPVDAIADEIATTVLLACGLSPD